jgi:hypothetical protein
MAERIIVRLVGGLGNQLYQLSYALFLRREFGADVISLDISKMGSYEEGWGLLIFDVLKRNKLGFLRFDRHGLSSVRPGKALFFAPRVAASIGLITDRNQELYPNVEKRARCFVDGYFETFSRRSEYPELLRPFLRDDLLIDVPENVTVLNVRGGAFKSIGRSSLEDRDFYLDALKATPSNQKLWLVTDDVPFAFEMLGDSLDFAKIIEPDPFWNFRVIYSAKHKILSNSTFAKWAGYLSSDFSNSTYFGEF